jgi:UTP--glucose-1-phosphate uridylyltransferase
MLLPDDLIIKQNCSKSMIKIHNQYNSSVMASMNVAKKTVTRWGIYKLKKKISKNNFLIDSVIEKPSIKSAPSNKAVIGRNILPKIIFEKLKNQKPSTGDEINITDAIQSLINDKEKFVAHEFMGQYLDCGTIDGFINSNKILGKK